MDGTLTSTTTLGQSGPGSNSNERVLHIPQTPKLEHHQQMQFNVIPRTLNGFKYCYQTLIILVNIIHLHTDKSFQVLLCNAKNELLITIHTHIYICTPLDKNISCPVGRGVRSHPPTSVLDMTLNNLVVRFRYCWTFGECGVSLHCHRCHLF